MCFLCKVFQIKLFSRVVLGKLINRETYFKLFLLRCKRFLLGQDIFLLQYEIQTVCRIFVTPQTIKPLRYILKIFWNFCEHLQSYWTYFSYWKLMRKPNSKFTSFAVFWRMITLTTLQRIFINAPIETLFALKLGGPPFVATLRFDTIVSH